RRLNQSLTLRRKIPYRKMRDFLVYSGQDSNRRARRGSIRRRFRDKPGEQAADPIPHSKEKNPLSKDEGFLVYSGQDSNRRARRGSIRRRFRDKPGNRRLNQYATLI